MSRLAFPPMKNLFKTSQQVLRRNAVSKTSSSSIHTRSALSNIPPNFLTEPSIIRDPGSLSWFKRIGSSKMYYSSSTRFTNSTKPRPPLPEEAVNPISWKSFFIPVSALAGLGGLAFFIHNNDENRAVPKGKGVKFEKSAIQGPIIGGLFSLINTEGQLVTEKNLLGNWILLYFGYTSSPDIGPAEVQKMAKSIDLVEAESQGLAHICYTPSHLRAYIREFDSRIVGLSGAAGAVRQMAQKYRVFFRKIDEDGDDYLIESSHDMYLMNPNMQVTRSFGVEYNAEELAEAITKEIKKN